MPMASNISLWAASRLSSIFKDMGLFIKADPENAKATYAALAQFGAPLEAIRAEDFMDHNSFFRFGRDPTGFDILPAIPVLDFDAAWENVILEKGG